jgi:hypothetical protein
MMLRSEYKRDFHVCMIVSVSTKAITGMKVKKQKKGVRHFHDRAL